MVVFVFGGGVVSVGSTQILFLKSSQKYQKFFVKTPVIKNPSISARVIL
jgi:hypothetical protein